MIKIKQICMLAGTIALIAIACQAQDDSYDDEGYGGQGGAGNNQGDGDNYGGGYANDDGYSGNMANYPQNVDSDGSNNQANNYSPQGGSDADPDYEGEDNSAAASSVEASVVVPRAKRSVPEAKTADEPLKPVASEAKLRVKRHGKYYIGPVYTYVKTDKHANFKWGVKHKVGKKHHG